jgi:hypothetical protein
MFNFLRTYFFNKALRLSLAAARRRRPQTLRSARTIALLFDATVEKNRREWLEFARRLEKEGKTVQLLGYFSEKALPESAGFDVFSAKELNWKGLPKSEKALSFAQGKPDLLLCYNPDEQRPLAWVAATIQAGMKIGTVTDTPNDFDLLLETPTAKGVRFFLDQLHLYLEKIVLTKHEPARAL